MQPVSIMINGQAINLGLHPLPELARAVVISLFAWRRAKADDKLPGTTKNGWWGDTYPDVEGDRIGSRLWLLSRDVLSQDTLLRAEEYAREALAWLVEDGIAQSVAVSVARLGLDKMEIATQITRPDGSGTDIRMTALWSAIKG
ncbi:MAG: phage GP46 family protein [Oxalobacter formigenes]|nr:phage GP46 family protein [Oxalobacter formigenes]